MTITANNLKRIKCPKCGGKGVVFKAIDSVDDFSANCTVTAENYEEERLSALTGTAVQVTEALTIRTGFILQAKIQYNPEHFRIFIKLISYEAHALFWIWSKNRKIGAIIAKIAAKNPTAFELIEKMSQ